jgi:enoyl-CoA hydratase/carnithine racemase
MSDLRIDLASLLEQRAAELPDQPFLTLSGGARLTAADMLSPGMVSAVMPGEDIESAAVELARTPCERTATSLRLGKQAVRTADEASRETDLAADIAAMLVCYARGSQQQATARFTSKPQGSI